MEGRRADASEADRREFLLSLGKWSTVFIAAVVGGALLHSSAEGGGTIARPSSMRRPSAARASSGGSARDISSGPVRPFDAARDRILLRVIGGI